VAVAFWHELKEADNYIRTRALLHTAGEKKCQPNKTKIQPEILLRSVVTTWHCFCRFSEAVQ